MAVETQGALVEDLPDPSVQFSDVHRLAQVIVRTGFPRSQFPFQQRLEIDQDQRDVPEHEVILQFGAKQEAVHVLKLSGQKNQVRGRPVDLFHALTGVLHVGHVVASLPQGGCERLGGHRVGVDQQYVRVLRKHANRNVTVF